MDFEKSMYESIANYRRRSRTTLHLARTRARPPVLSVEIDALDTAVGHVIAPKQLTAVRIVGHGPGVDQPPDHGAPDVRVQIQRLDGAPLAVAPVQLKKRHTDWLRRPVGIERSIRSRGRVEGEGGDRSRTAIYLRRG